MKNDYYSLIAFVIDEKKFMAIIRDDGAPGSYRSILACQAQDLPGRRVDALMGREKSYAQKKTVRIKSIPWINGSLLNRQQIT